ncbi:MAG: DNA repair protein RecO [Actinomycetia bacterium]|nr:DNA repair protein RecO [Actinomycetes bacterium]
MPTEPVELLVLKKTKLGETDLIITGYSSDGRQIRAVVKGGRKPGSRTGSHLELFCRSSVLLYKGRKLDTVTEAKLLEAHVGCRQGIEHHAAASVLAELLEQVSRDAFPEPRLFALVDTTFAVIAKVPVEGLSLLVAAGLLKITAQAGFLPCLDCCAVCGSPTWGQAGSAAAGEGAAAAAENAEGAESGSASGSARGTVAFSYLQGGVVCPDCQTELSSEGLAELPSPLLKWADLAIHSRFEELVHYADDAHQKLGKLLLGFAREWMRAHVSPKNRSLDFYTERCL